MPVLSYIHELFHINQCHASIHTLRWKERSLQWPRRQSHDVDPWGMYHYRPGCKRSWCHGCQRTFNDLTDTLLHQSKRSLPYWMLATFLWCLSCSSRRIAESWVSMAGPVIAGAGGGARRPCPTKPSAGGRAPWKRMTSLAPPTRRAKRKAGARRRWDAARGGAARSASPGGGMMTRTDQPSSRGSAARGGRPPRDQRLHREDGAEGR